MVHHTEPEKNFDGVCPVCSKPFETRPYTLQRQSGRWYWNGHVRIACSRVHGKQAAIASAGYLCKGCSKPVSAATTTSGYCASNPVCRAAAKRALWDQKRKVAEYGRLLELTKALLAARTEAHEAEEQAKREAAEQAKPVCSDCGGPISARNKSGRCIQCYDPKRPRGGFDRTEQSIVNNAAKPPDPKNTFGYYREKLAERLGREVSWEEAMSTNIRENMRRAGVTDEDVWDKPPKECPHCKKTFKPKSAQQQYCTEVCRIASYKTRDED